MTYWITDRVPTRQDADADGGVVVCFCRRGKCVYALSDWDAVDLGEPWLPFILPRASEQSGFAAAKPPTPQPSTPQPPTPCLVERRFVSLISHSTALIAIADDGTSWIKQHASDCDWHPLRTLPPR